jgi:hypothetical protein
LYLFSGNVDISISSVFSIESGGEVDIKLEPTDLEPEHLPLSSIKINKTTKTKLVAEQNISNDTNEHNSELNTILQDLQIKKQRKTQIRTG